MNWIDHLEERRWLVIGGVLLVTLSALAISSMRGPVAFDPFWHLQMGKDWLLNGLDPRIDHYSFTYRGAPVANPPVAFQAVLHWLESSLGLEAGFAVFRLAGFVLILGTAFLLLRQVRARAIVYAVALPMIVYLLQLRSYVRPELVSHTFAILALMLYFRAGRSLAARHVVPMAILMLAWTNYHTSIVGYVIFFGYFLDCALARIRERAGVVAWAQWLAWGGLMLGVGFLNAGFTHPVLESLSFPTEWKVLINEYLPPASFSKYRAPGIAALVLLALATPVMALRQRQFGMLAVWAVMAFAAITMQRFVTPSGIVITLLAARLASNGDAFPAKTTGRGIQAAAALVAAVLAGVLLWSNVERGRTIMEENRHTIMRYPDAMVDYMIDQGMTGPVFNDYGIGGYLIYRMAPEVQVYIDGRTQILYPVEHMHRYVAATRHPEALRGELDGHGVDLVLWRRHEVAHDVIMDMGGFGLEFMDAFHVLYRRGPANFELLGKLLSRPACWSDAMRDELNAERRRMDEILPVYSVLYPFANFVTGYTNAEDGRAFLDASFEQRDWLDEMRRFAAFRFLESGQHDIARMLLGGVAARKPQDYLASALAMLQAGQTELAAQILAGMSVIDWQRIDPVDLHARYQLYQALAAQRALTPGEAAVAERAQRALQELGIPARPAAIQPGMFCAIASASGG